MNKFPGFNTAAKTGKVPGTEQSSSALVLLSIISWHQHQENRGLLQRPSENLPCEVEGQGSRALKTSIKGDGFKYVITSVPRSAQILEHKSLRTRTFFDLTT